MNEIEPSDFDYSTIDSDTASYLKDRENSMSKTLEGAAEKLGEDLYKAQQKLAKKGYGNFEAWYKSLGLKTSSVYRYINRYKFVSSKLEDSKMLEIFQELPPSLKNEMSKPSAKEELNQKVYDGDITTHKQYKELEKKLKEKNSQLEQVKKSEQIAIDKLEEEQSKEPETVKVVPPDYDYYKSNYEATKSNYEFYKKQNDELRNEMKLLEKRITNAGTNAQEVESLKNELDEVKQKLKRKEEEYHRLDNFKSDAEAIIHKYAPVRYFKDFDEVLKDKQAFGDLEDTIYMLEKWVKEMKEDLPNQIIIEGDN